MSNLENAVVTNITLYADVSKRNAPVSIYAKQFDANSRYLKVRLMQASGEISVSGLPQLNCTKPNNQLVYISGTVEDDGTILFALTSNILSEIGKVSCDVSVFDTEDTEEIILTSSTFYIVVDKSNYDAEAIEGFNEFATVSEMLAQAAETKTAIEGLKSDIEEDVILKGDGLEMSDKQLYLTSGSTRLTSGISFATDSTLTQSGEPADAKAAGDIIDTINESVAGISNAVLDQEEIDLTQIVADNCFISSETVPTRDGNSATTSEWEAETGDECWIIHVPDGVKCVSVTADSSNPAIVAMLASDTTTTGEEPDYADDKALIAIEASVTKRLSVPAECHYIYIAKANGENDYTPSEVEFETSSAPAVDSTLSQEGVPADAKATGDTITQVEESLTEATQPTVYRTIKTESGSDLKNVWSVHNALARNANSVIVTLEPKQASGTPSSDSPKAITGYTSYSIRKSTGNLFDPSKAICGHYLNSSGAVTVSEFYWTSEMIPVDGISVLRMRWKNDTSNNRTARITFYDAEKNYLPGSYYDGFGSNKTAFRTSTRNVPSGAAYVRFGSYNDGYLTIEGDSALIINAEPFPEAAGTVYAGYIDVTNGKLYKTWSEINPYAGETIPGKWISSMDVYEAGVTETPTEGAQVIYELETPEEYDITPHEILMKENDTMLLAPNGDPYQNSVTVTYAVNDLITATETDKIIYDKVYDASLSFRLKLYPSQFIGRAYRNASTLTVTTANAYATPISTRMLRFTGQGKVHFYSTDPNVEFRLLEVSTSYDDIWITREWVQDWLYNGEHSVYLELHKLDSSYVTVDDLDSIYVMVNEPTYETAVASNTYMYKLTATNNFPNSYEDTDWITRYGMYTSDGQEGFAARGNSEKRITTPLYADSDVTIMPGAAGDIVLDIYIDGEITNVNSGQWLTIPAGKYFAICFRGSNSSATSNFQKYVKYIVAGSSPGASSNQVLTPATLSGRADAAWIVGDNVWMVSQTGNYGVYSLATGETLKDITALDHSAGHANSCNYENGYVYVSDWTDPTLIHVYTVDNEELTLTYTKDLVVPHTEYGSTEYYVTDNEKQIVFLGWRTGNSGTADNCLVYGLYVKTTSGYELSYVRKAVRPEMYLQGFTVQDRYIYYISGEAGTYHTDYIQRIDMVTGLTNRYPSGADTTLSGSEGEAIIPIDVGSFILVDVAGRVYFMCAEV